MKMFEKMKIGTRVRHVTGSELADAKKVYGRYVGFLKELYGDEYGIDGAHTAMSLAEFLLQDIDYNYLDSFMWDKGVLVKTKSGLIGLTVGWTPVNTGSNSFAVSVKTSRGVAYFFNDDLEKAEVPPEVLDYVKSTLQDKVHGKIDEAFKEN